MASKAASGPLAVESRGIPLSVIAAPANRRDDGLLATTLERRRLVVEFWLALACVIVIIRRLIRRAWTQGDGMRARAADHDLPLPHRPLC